MSSRVVSPTPYFFLEFHPEILREIPGFADDRQYLLGEGVIFGMHPGVVQGIGALRDLQEASALLEGLVAQAGNALELVPARDPPLGLAVLHDLLGQPRVDARDVPEEAVAGGIQVDADIVDYGVDHLVQGIREAFLVDVVLVKPHAYALGVDLHEFGQGVLEAAAYGDGPADGQVELRELLAGDVAGGIDRGAVLIHDRVGYRPGSSPRWRPPRASAPRGWRCRCRRRRAPRKCFRTASAMAFLPSSGRTSWLMTK